MSDKNAKDKSKLTPLEPASVEEVKEEPKKVSEALEEKVSKEESVGTEKSAEKVIVDEKNIATDESVVTEKSAEQAEVTEEKSEVAEESAEKVIADEKNVATDESVVTEKSAEQAEVTEEKSVVTEEPAEKVSTDDKSTEEVIKSDEKVSAAEESTDEKKSAEQAVEADEKFTEENITEEDGEEKIVNSALKRSSSTKNKGNKKSGKNMMLCLIAIIAFISMACGFFYANDRSKKDVGSLSPTQTSTETTKEVSLEQESIEAQRILDNILLKKNNWQLKEEEHGLKEVALPGIEAKVKINQRELNVGVPATTNLDAAGDWLKEKVEQQGLVYLGGEECVYKKWEGYRARVGIKTKAGKESKSFLTDTVIFFHNTNLLREDRDVKENTVRAATTRKYKGKVAILIDDCGQTLDPLKSLLDTNLPFSYAILPNKPYSTEALNLIKAKGRVAMLHLPMEAMGNAPEEKITINVIDGPKEQAAKTRKLLATLPGVVGVNNHQGSRATGDSDTMKAVLKEIKSKGMFFIDSNTSSKSVARDTARSMSVSTARNDIFLDNEADVEYIRKKIYEAFARAERNGSVIAICHARNATAACWAKYKDEFKASGVEFVSVTSLLY